MAAVFLRLTSFICSIIFKTMVRMWMSSLDNDNCLEIFPTRSFPSQSTQKALEADSLLSQCPAADVGTSPLTLAQPANYHKHNPELPVGWG